MQKILFLTTAHRYNDDRIFYHQAKELLRQGYEVKISSLSSDLVGEKDGIAVESYPILDQPNGIKTNAFRRIIHSFRPDVIIGSEPLAILAANDYTRNNPCSLIYDITEWYPSMRMLEGSPTLLKPLHFVKFFFIQILAGVLSSHFIFGERTKRFPLAQLFSLKPQIILPYYPDSAYITPNVKVLSGNSITLCYTGVFSKEKGIANFLNAADHVRRLRPELEVNILLVGSARQQQQAYFDSLLAKFNFRNMRIVRPADFEDFSQTFAEADICFDLRDKNFENHHCLPIKIFYYAAAGKPVIYTDLKAIRRHMDISNFGYLVDPEHASQIAKIIFQYVDQPDLYAQHAGNALSAGREYNWEAISQDFVTFVKQSLVKK